MQKGWIVASELLSSPHFGIKCIQIYTSQFFAMQFVCMLIGFQKVVGCCFFNPPGTFYVQAKCFYTHDRAISSLWKVLLDRNTIAEQTLTSSELLLVQIGIPQQNLTWGQKCSSLCWWNLSQQFLVGFQTESIVYYELAHSVGKGLIYPSDVENNLIKTFNKLLSVFIII